MRVILSVTPRVILSEARDLLFRLAPLLLLVALPAFAAAQRGEDTLPRGHVVPAFGIHAGSPQKASAALGVLLGEDWQKNGRDHSRNVALFVEPGLGAGRISVAYVDHGYGAFGSGYGIAGTVLRTWKDPWTVKPNITYAGAELILWPVLFVGPRIGLLHGVSGSMTEKRWLVSLDFGIGL
ncbi:MAG: hypothetical protein ACREPM_06415 [Gemmatimonadaceae bacterium]